jgi:very-short-patch-repair endonuclease
MLPYNKNLKERARQLRANMTDAERYLWAKIRMKQLKGYWFYRQKPIGDYIVDFFCPKAKLIIEVDGSQHFVNETIEYDRIREEYVSSLGLKVLRFTNTEVLKHVEGVVERIEEEINEKIPLIPPFSKGETQVSPFEKRGDMIASPFRKGRMRGI